jgi:membrane peptidoglycan carboxypeptidase
MAPADDPDALFAATNEVLTALRRLTRLSERLLESATGEPLTPEQARQARSETETTREGIEQIDAMLTLRRQRLRPM